MTHSHIAESFEMMSHVFGTLMFDLRGKSCSFLPKYTQFSL